MILLLALGVGATVAAGVYCTLSRDLLRCVVGVSLLAAAANVVVLAAGRVTTSAPPVIPPGAETLTLGASPLPQALVLTAIVIGFSLTCYSLVTMLTIKQLTGVADSHALRAAEPPPDTDGAPALEERDEVAP